MVFGRCRTAGRGRRPMRDFPPGVGHCARCASVEPRYLCRCTAVHRSVAAMTRISADPEQVFARSESSGPKAALRDFTRLARTRTAPRSELRAASGMKQGTPIFDQCTTSAHHIATEARPPYRDRSTALSNQRCCIRHERRRAFSATRPIGCRWRLSRRRGPRQPASIEYLGRSLCPAKMGLAQGIQWRAFLPTC